VKKPGQQNAGEAGQSADGYVREEACQSIHGRLVRYAKKWLPARQKPVGNVCCGGAHNGIEDRAEFPVRSPVNNPGLP